MTSANRPVIQLLRQLFSEIRLASSENKIKDTPIVQYILNEARKHNVTQEQYCKSKEEMTSLANTYLCYLRSKRKHLEIVDEYAGKGERSIRETADMVGFKLPHDPKK